MQKADYDLCVIGGGINGAGVARDAAGRGLSVLLVDAGDLAGVTSSASSKMLHGGLRYLENIADFPLVREGLRERKTIMEIAPHISRQMDFVLPQNADEAQRPAWMIRTGLFLYDMLAGRKKLSSSRAVGLQDNKYGAPLKDIFETAFLYTDGQVDDARLVVLNVISAAQNGADVRTYTACTGMRSDNGIWTLQMHNQISGQSYEVSAKTIVNAAGPSVTQLLSLLDGGMPSDAPAIRQVKGSHIIIERLYEGDHGYLFQNPDGRVIFLWPYEQKYTLVGTTDEDYEGDPRAAMISEAEMEYLCEAMNAVCKKQITREDVHFSFSGVRPLIDSGQGKASKVSRRHLLHEHHGVGGAKIISVYGGKLTTYRAIAEEVVDKITKRRKGWTAHETLPGGDIDDGDFHSFLLRKEAQYSFIPRALIKRYAKAYGTAMDAFLEKAETVQDLGSHLGDDLYEAEVQYLLQHEFARTAEDILWRRSKLGLHVRDDTVQALKSMLASPHNDGGV
ncbi:MAG: glycerol-3-phosphate dehydrogenase [Alphaproteobacteria bacterium]|nr:glycerol-3-phosphate dehydrogenase [Alphaproteobacteria bacterium]